MARVEFTTREINPEDGPLVAGVRGLAYCSSPPCTIVGEGEVLLGARRPATWVELAYLRVREPAQGLTPLTHEAYRDGSRRRLDDGRGHTRDLVIDLVGVSRLYGLGKGDLIELSIHDEGSNEVERYYFELRPVRGDGLPDRVDVDVAVGVLPIPEGARSLDPEQARVRGDVARATFPLALQVSFGWNTVSRATAWSEFADRVDLVLGLAVITFQGLPSGLESKTAPALGPGLRIHRLLNFVWYFDLFGKDPVSFPALAVSLDEGLRLASSLLATDVIHKQPEPQRFRITLSGGAGAAGDNFLQGLSEHVTDRASLFPLGHLSFGRRWSDHWTFAQLDFGTLWIPQVDSGDDLVLLRVMLGPRIDGLLWRDRLSGFVGLQAGFYQGYLLRAQGSSEVRLRSGFAFPAGFTFPLVGRGGLATWSLTSTTTLHLVYDFAGSTSWTRLISSELGVAVEF